MNHFDIGIAWDWEYDRDFVYLLNDAALGLGFKPYIISYYNLTETIEKVERDELSFSNFVDRASDSEPLFKPLVELLVEKEIRFLNPPSLIERANDKAKMHIEFMANGIDVPYTIILSPSDEFDENHPYLKTIGTPFVVKPAFGGGGVGVVLGAKEAYTVTEARLQSGRGFHLIQERVIPRILKGKRAWFRVFYVCGNVIPCWWDDMTHIYERLAPEEEEELIRLKEIAVTAHRISQLNFFSTEIAITEEGKFVAVDYINDICDMRLKSTAPNGVPDSVVKEIVECICKDGIKSR